MTRTAETEADVKEFREIAARVEAELKAADPANRLNELEGRVEKLEQQITKILDNNP